VEALQAIAGGNPEEAFAARSVQAAETTINLVPQSAGASTPAIDVAQLPQDEEGLLKEAKNLLLSGNYPAAQQASTSFLAKYPKSKSASDAQYMLADSLLYQDNYQEAANAYGKLVGDYPKSDNAPSSLVKFARALRLLDKKTDACKTLDLMAKQYPKAPAAAKTMATSERQKANCK
jgi:tol-pal system protein YbgF